MIDEYFKSLLKVFGIGAAFAALPLFVSLAELEPPWPPAAGVVSSLFILVGAMLAWEFTRKSRVVHRRRWMMIGAAMMVVGILLYMIAYSFFVEPVPGTSLRVVRGYECTREAAQLYPLQCPDLPRQALEDAEWEALVLWTRSSVTVARVSLAFAWFFFISGLIVCIGAGIAGRTFSRGKEAVAESAGKSAG